MALKLKKKVKEAKPEKKKDKKDKKRLINTICIIFLCCVLVGSVGTFAIVQSVLAKGNLAGIEELGTSDTTVIYDRYGEEAYTLSMGSGVRKNVEYEQIPQVVIDAFLAIEDSRFYKHNGFDFPRFLKSLYENIKGGGIVQGGSTLTMQLVDVALYEESEKINFGFKEKLEQKIQEIFKSMDIETQISKEVILEYYLNNINFGGPARGIQKGAEYYFGKNVEDVTLGEAAFLAGVINAPTYNNPYYGFEQAKDENGNILYSVNHYEAATKRRNAVLYQMYNHGYIDETEYKLAISQELAFQLNGTKNFATEKFKAFVDAAVAEVQAVTGLNPHEVPMKIYTTMDPKAQEKADALCDGEGINWPDELFQTGFAAVNNQTGEIVALGGGRGYDGQFNRATIEKHQIGSTAKPLIDYAPAFEYVGYSTEHTILDAPVPEYANGQTLHNADRTFRGEVTLKTAIGLSLNVPAYKALKDVASKVGEGKVVDLLNLMGLEIEDGEFSYGMSIGGGNFDTTPLQLAGAYSVFANQGNYIKPYTVTKVEFLDGKTDTYEVEVEEQKVFSPETAYLMSYMLKDAVENASYQTLVNTLRSGYTVYGKSGTTDLDAATAADYGFPAGVARDKWMVGYTSEYTVACWAGYDRLIKGQNTYLDYQKLWANVEGTVVKAMLDTLHAESKPGTIARPSGVVDIAHVKGVYPYAAASADMDESMISKGLINKKFAKLEEAITPEKLSDLADMSINLDGYDLNIAYTPYPDADKLNESKGTVKVQGKEYSVFFDNYAVFGQVQYKYNVYVNNVLVTSGNGSTDKLTETLSVKNGDVIKVEGWYGYAKTDAVKSNVITKTIKVDGLTQQYTVIFNTNGGDEIPAIQVNGGETIALTRPRKNGAVFEGWYLDEAFTTPFTMLDKVNSNIVLYAKWR